MRSPRCPDCRVLLLRRAGWDDDGWWCPLCDGRFLAKSSLNSPVVRFSRYRPKQNQVANEAPGAPYEILELADGSLRLCIDKRAWVLSPTQVEHLADSATNAAKWGHDRRDVLRGRYQFVVTQWGDGYKVGYDDCVRVLVPTTIRAERKCYVCRVVMRNGSAAWKAVEPDHHPARAIDWRWFRMCSACPERLLRKVPLLGLQGGRGQATPPDETR